MGKAVIRPYRPEDREAVRHICFETGLMGDPVRSQYRDSESFADVFSSYYTDHEPHNALVADLQGKVVGYLFGCRDTRKMPTPYWIMLKHVLLRGVCFRPGTMGFYWRATLDTVVDLFRGERPPKVDLERFPSHTHNNLLPEGRGAGVGKEFFFELFDRLKEQGSTGLYGEVLADNANMIQFGLAKLGYQPHGKPYLVPGMRTPDGKRMRVRMFTRDLTTWVSGAWKQAASKREGERAAGESPARLVR